VRRTFVIVEVPGNFQVVGVHRAAEPGCGVDALLDEEPAAVALVVAAQNVLHQFVRGRADQAGQRVVGVVVAPRRVGQGEGDLAVARVPDLAGPECALL
jgi:hypothetical protein